MRCLPQFGIACFLLCLLWSGLASAQQLQCEPCRHGFGPVQIDSSKSFLFELWNPGNRTLTITSISVQGSPFSLGAFQLPAKIKPGTSAQLPVTFTPTSLGYVFGALTVDSKGNGSPLEIYVAGRGTDTADPELTISPETLNFGNVTVASSSSLQVTLTAANASVTISSDQSTNSEFAVVGLNLPVTLEVGQSQPVTIQFTPNASGRARGEVEFFSTGVDSPTVEHVTGAGVASGTHSVDLSWNPVSGDVVGYNVFRSTVNGGPYQQLNSGLDTSTAYTDNTVVSGSTYYYAVTDVNSQGEQSSYSNVAEVVIP